MSTLPRGLLVGLSFTVALGAWNVNRRPGDESATLMQIYETALAPSVAPAAGKQRLHDALLRLWHLQDSAYERNGHFVARLTDLPAFQPVAGAEIVLASSGDVAVVRARIPGVVLFQVNIWGRRGHPTVSTSYLPERQ